MNLHTTLMFCELSWGQQSLSCCLGERKFDKFAPAENSMKPHISMVTLGVSDLARSTAFYRDGLGLPTEGDFEGVAFFKLRGTWLSLFPREELTKDAAATEGGNGFGGFTLAHNVGSPKEVGEVLEQAQKAGAKILKPAQDAFWGGHHGFFADMDGFVWEVAWNPHLDLT
ncbi:hypothetical protein IAD21_02876 [Abditibacteriota bacterium]|nr:hypothetical protein IAD21_02876 [Abditibacteriota bacterium]